jgi:hypothetical protein
MVSDKLFKIFLRVFCTVIIRCTETFLSPCICSRTLYIAIQTLREGEEEEDDEGEKKKQEEEKNFGRDIPK